MWSVKTNKFTCPGGEFLRAGHCCYHHSHSTYINSLLVCLSAKYKQIMLVVLKIIHPMTLSWNISDQNEVWLLMGQAASPNLPEFSLLSKYPTCLLSTPGHSVNSQFHSIKYISDRLKQNLCTPLLNRKKKVWRHIFCCIIIIRRREYYICLASRNHTEIWIKCHGLWYKYRNWYAKFGCVWFWFMLCIIKIKRQMN